MTIRYLAVLFLVLSLASLLVAQGRNTVPTSGSRSSFTIQVMSVLALEEAEAAIQRLRTKGIDAYWLRSELPGQGLRYRVRVGRYDTRESAQAYALQLRRQGAISDYFVALWEQPALNGRANSTTAVTDKVAPAPQNQQAAVITRQDLSDLTQRRDKLSAADKVFAEGGELYQQGTPEAYRRALGKYETATGLYRVEGNKAREALALARIGFLYAALGRQQQALKYYELALPLIREVADWRGEATTLNNLGDAYSALGEKQKALKHYEQALLLSRAVADRRGEATTLNNIGLVNSDLGEKWQALKYYEQALRLYRAVADRRGEARALSNLGAVYADLGQPESAVKCYEQALPLFRAVGDRRAEATTLSNWGAVYTELGEPRQALRYFEQALPLRRAVGDQPGVAATLHNLGRVYNNFGQPQEALKYYEQALAIFRLVEDRAGETATLNNLGTISADLGQSQYALKYFEQALLLSRAVTDRRSEATALNNLGRVYATAGERQQALKYYEQALPLRRAVGDRLGEATTLRNLMFLWRERGRPRLAIIFGKQSVNVLQQLRSNIGRLDRAVQRSFLKSNEATYRYLAELLIEAGRIGEAEQVLSMLKEEEYFEFIRRNEKMAAALKARSNLTEAEAKAIVDYERLGDRLTALGTELAKLDEQRLKLPETAAFPHQARYDELKTQLTAAIKTFEVFQHQLAEEFGKENVRVREIESGLQASLQSWGLPGTVIVYTIAASDRLYVIVTTPKVQEPHYTEIKAEELNRLVAEFRRALTDPAIDPRLAGQKLYELLVKPLEADLKGAEAKTLLWSLDGVLRYVPIAALWDGKQYLAERFDNVLIALASRDKVAVAPQPVEKWRGLGVGVSQPWREFPALPAVPVELKSIIRQEQASAQEQGVLPGRRLLDGEFTRTALERALGRYSVIHVASHFSFQPGHEKSAYLLLGDGSPYPLEAVATSTPLFTGVELLTLSACNTAMGGEAGGKEIEGFGMLAQKQGALSVIATLWAVADESTGLLMREFYRLRITKPEITKADALRRAQLALLRGELRTSGGAQKRSELVGEEAKRQNAFKTAGQAPYAHPYYWAPFILIGNWR
jgi:CHAT domain-containing protein/Tfp pilus assembly protein PilF